MEIKEEVRDDVVVLTLGSETVTAAEVSELHRNVKELTRNGLTKVVVNLENVRWFGSAMLGVLVASLSTLRDAGGDLRLANTATRMQSVFAATQLASLFKNYESLDRAVSSYIVSPVKKP